MEKRITSPQHPFVKHLVKLRDKRSYRYEQGKVLVEGHKIVSEVGQVDTLVVMDGVHVPTGVNAEQIVEVSPAVMGKISGVESPEGVVAEVAMPSLTLQKIEGRRRLLVLEGLKDPGNMGTLIRTALALGWEGVVVMENSCDPFNDKALRAAKGATFRLPIAFANWEELEPLAKNMKLLIADLEGTAAEAFVREEAVLLLLGSESQGVSAEAKRLGTAVSIPMPGPMESLNVSVAGGILLYVLR